MDLAIGVVLGLASGALASMVGFDRDRAFYPAVMIVIASYYVLFAAMAEDHGALWRDGAVALIFVVAAIAGFRISLWLVVAALAAHGVLDLVHGGVLENDGVPTWWPGFCAAFDLVLAAWLAALLIRRGEPRRAATG